jgi:uncharacterized protein (DUF983 family)
MSNTAPDSTDAFPRRSPIWTGLAGRCPRCGKRSIFDGFLALKSACPNCGLDLERADTGDGPAFFASFFGSFALLAVGVWMQIALNPPIWAYAVLFLVGAVFLVALIRPLKGLLTSLQYANQAEQGRFEP